ncbi:hypothetical protein ACP4OV_010836 [Aristida adscensionis]
MAPPTRVFASPVAGDAPPSRSASAIVAGADSGSHVLKIIGYSHTKEVPNGTAVTSRPFTMARRIWFVEYYPNGDKAGDEGFIAIFLVLRGTVAEDTNAKVTISLLDQGGNPVPAHSYTTSFVNFSAKGNWGYHKFIDRGALDDSEHVKNDSFSVRFDITVMKGFRTVETPLVAVPPSDLHQHLGNLLVSKEHTDVKFRVGGSTFSAHRLVLAARSPVFKAELYGPMKESSTGRIIRIDDMEAEVFCALLAFIYTDTLPGMQEEDESVLIQHLLVAADRYGLERLKSICEDKLCKRIDTGSVGTVLALAEQHNCRGLKEECFEFLRSPTNLDEVMETDGFEYLTRTCPHILKELLSKITHH